MQNDYLPVSHLRITHRKKLPPAKHLFFELFPPFVPFAILCVVLRNTRSYVKCPCPKGTSFLQKTHRAPVLGALIQLSSQIVICAGDTADVIGACRGWDGVHMVGGRVQKDYGIIEEVKSWRIGVRVIAFKPYARKCK
jgi:hypothetical protein